MIAITLGKRPSSHTDTIKRKERRGKALSLVVRTLGLVRRGPYTARHAPRPSLSLEVYAFDRPPLIPLLTSNLIFLLLSTSVLLDSTHK